MNPMEPVAEVSVQETKFDPLETIFFKFSRGGPFIEYPPVYDDASLGFRELLVGERAEFEKHQ